MEVNAIPDIRVESAGDEVTYHLPVRPLGALRLMGLLPIGFSALWVGGLGSFLWPMLHRTSIRTPAGAEYFLWAFVLCFALIGCAPAGFGILVLFGRCRVRWRDGRLSVSEMVGPFGWPRRMPRKGIRRFIVVGGGGAGAAGPMVPGPFGRLAALFAEFESAPRRTVVTGYPREWLEAVAQDLSIRAGLSQSAPPVVDVRGGFFPPAVSPEVKEQPAGSKVGLRRGDASIILDVPPLGLRKGSMGLVYFAAFWLMMVAGFTAAFLFGGKGGSPVGPALPFLGIFWVVGLGMMAAVINMGWGRATLTAGPSGLTVVKNGPFGSKRLEFRRPEIATINVGSSNIRVNHRLVPELQIHVAGGGKTGLLAGHDPDELAWMVTELRKALGLAAEGQSDSTPPLSRAEAAALLQRRGSPLGAFVFFICILAVLVAVKYVGVHGVSHVASRPVMPVAAVVPSKPIPAGPGLAFDSFGPSHSFGTNAWAAGREAHADWFVAAASGYLTEIQLALSPIPRRRAATVFIAKDEGGFPGKPMESLSVSPASGRAALEAGGPVTVKSVKHPMLEAGVKYWVGAKSPGGWQWNFNNQNILQNAARQPPRQKWASAGDYCYVCAFSVGVTTNPPATGVDQPVTLNAGSTNSQ